MKNVRGLLPNPNEIRKRSVTLNGHRTSISLEPPFWDALKDAAARAGNSLNGFIAQIEAESRDDDHQFNLSSAIRVWLLNDALVRAKP